MEVLCQPGLRTQGFTLLEMAVGVALIGLLAALILPFGRQALDKAGAVKCSANLKQIAAVALAWSADNDGRLPDRNRWYSRTKNDRYSFFPYLGLPNDGMPYTKPGAYTCPVFNRKYPTTASPIRTYSINRYAIGSFVDNEEEWQKILAAEPPLQLQRVAQPSRMMFFMDGRPGDLSGAPAAAGYRAYAAVDSISPENIPHLHERGLNAVFLDGHAEHISSTWIAQQELDSNRKHVFWGANK